MLVAPLRFACSAPARTQTPLWVRPSARLFGWHQVNQQRKESTMTSNTPSTPNRPYSTIRDGGLKATLWQRQGEKGSFYTVELSRTYTDADGKFHDSHSYSGSELLRIARLADIAYGEILIAKGLHPEPEANVTNPGDSQ